MNKLNNIFKMVSQLEKNAEEVKLAKHEVELASLQMITAMHDNGIDIYKQGQNWAKEMEAFTKKSRELNRMAVALSNGLEKEINDFEKQAKELGINTNNLPELNKAISILGPLDNVIKMTERFK
jgi:hypothetical protein